MNPYIPIERFNGLEYAYIATQNDVAPCQQLYYNWTLNPGNIQCGSGTKPTLEAAQYSQRTLIDIACGAPSAFWKGNTACKLDLAGPENKAVPYLLMNAVDPQNASDSVSVTLKNQTNPAQTVSKVLATNVYVKSEIPTLNACVASLAVPTVNQTFSVGSTAAYVVKLNYDPVGESDA